MSRIDVVGEAAGWRCWLCDEPVDPDMSVNDPRGPSVDAVTTKARTRKKKAAPQERLAHRACNTGKGATEPVVPWSPDCFVVDPAPILPAVERLARRGGRELLGRSPTRDDADTTAAWLAGRVERLAPDLGATTEVDEGGGSFLVFLVARA